MRDLHLGALLDLQRDLTPWPATIRTASHYLPALGHCEWCGAISCPALATVGWVIPRAWGNEYDGMAVGRACIAELVELASVDGATTVEVFVDDQADAYALAAAA